MSSNEKKGVTVKINADLHAEVRQYIEQHEMTMAEFITLALQDELHHFLGRQKNLDIGVGKRILMGIAFLCGRQNLFGNLVTAANCRRYFERGLYKTSLFYANERVTYNRKDFCACLCADELKVTFWCNLHSVFHMV